MPKPKWNLNTIYISERLQEGLRPISRCAMTTVVAPMGYGKTTAVNWYLEERAKAGTLKIIRISVYSDMLAPGKPMMEMIENQVYLVQGAYAKVIGYSAELLPVCEAMHYALVALHLCIQTAAAYERLGKSEEAHAWLRKALSDAEPDGLVMPFVENYDILKPLLEREIKNDLISKSIELGEAATARNAAGTRPAAFDVLTPREFEIVELMVQRLSNREIAEKLYLSEGSVKQYVNQIYSKLHIEGDTRIKRKQLAELLR